MWVWVWVGWCDEARGLGVPQTLAGWPAFTLPTLKQVLRSSEGCAFLLTYVCCPSLGSVMLSAWTVLLSACSVCCCLLGVCAAVC